MAKPHSREVAWNLARSLQVSIVARGAQLNTPAPPPPFRATSLENQGTDRTEPPTYFHVQLRGGFPAGLVAPQQQHWMAECFAGQASCEASSVYPGTLRARVRSSPAWSQWREEQQQSVCRLDMMWPDPGPCSQMIICNANNALAKLQGTVWLNWGWYWRYWRAEDIHSNEIQ